MSKDSGVKKVGGAAPVSTKAEGEGKKSKKIKKSEFKITDETVVKDASGKLISAVDEEGDLVCGTPEGFSFDLHKPLKKSAFAKSGFFMAHRAALLEFKGNKIIKMAQDMKAKADKFIAAGDDKAAKSLKKAEKTLVHLEMLKKELADSGVNVEEIFAKMQKDAVTKAEEKTKENAEAAKQKK